MTAPLILGTNSIKDEGYEVANSYRSNPSDSPKLSKTYSQDADSKKKLTFSAWFKKTKTGTTQDLFSAYRSSDGFQTDIIRFDSSDRFEFFSFLSPSGTSTVKTNRLFRDTSAFYNIVVRVDTTQSTASDRVRIYVNGVQETSFNTSDYPEQNRDLRPFGIGSGTEHTIGAVGTSNYFNGYIAECVYLDNQSLDPTSFGEFDEDSNIWKPKDVSELTFGTNGFYLDFEDSSALGNDVSGNNNDFTVNNLTSIDQTTDTCTNNFATLNPLVVQTGTANEPVFREGNLQIHGSTTGSIQWYAPSSIGVSSGKWYAEFKGGSASNQNGMVGVSYRPEEDARIDEYPGHQPHSYGYYVSGRKYNNNTAPTYGDAWSTDIIGVALDLDNHKLYFSKNGVWQNSGDPESGSTGTGSAYDLTTGETYFFCIGDGDRSYVNPFDCNFGNPIHTISSGNSDGNGYGNFEYSVPSGYYALCTKNLAEYG